MKSVKMQRTKYFTPLLFLFIGLAPGIAQQRLPAKNFAGANASILWNTTGISAGISGERIIISKRNTELSIKAVYEFRHGFGNLIYFSGSQDIRSTETSLIVNGYLFTGKRKTNRGFFVSAGTGAIYSNWKFDTGGKINYLRPTIEFGLGSKFRLSDKMALQWRNDLRFISPQPEKGGAGAVSTTTLALGF